MKKNIMALSITHCFEFITALRGFHVYGNTMNWKPYNGKEIVFKCELNNKHDEFAVCGKAMLPGKIASVIVVYVPKENIKIYLVRYSVRSESICNCG